MPVQSTGGGISAKAGRAPARVRRVKAARWVVVFVSMGRALFSALSVATCCKHLM
jgi:hypothetical protein